MIKKIVSVSWMILFLWTAAISQQSQVSLLNEAYKTNSTKKLKLFIERWASVAARSLSKNMLGANDTTKAALDLYRDFYLSENGDFQQATSNHPMYLVLNNNLQVRIVDSLPIADPSEDLQYEPDFMQLNRFSYESGHFEKTLTTFVPPLNIPHVRILSLNESYRTMLENFLTVKPGMKRKNEYGILETVEEGHDDLKVNFLSAYLPMVQRHWGHYWNYLSYPNIDRIVLNKDLSAAIVCYDHSSSSGIACYIKKKSGWTFIAKRILVMQ